MREGERACSEASWDFVAFHAAARPERLAATDLASGSRWTCRGLDDRIARCVTVLAARGVRQGDRVGVLARNSVDVIVVQFACTRLGAIATILNWRLKAAELSVILADAAPALLIADAACAELQAESAGAIPGLALDVLRASLAEAAPAPRRPIDLDAPSIMLYTSGTSGTPKGVLLSERNAYYTGANFCLTSQIDRHSALLCDAPLFHVIGLVIGLRACLYQGAAILISDSFDPMVTNARLADPALAVTHYFCVPQMAAALRSVPNFDPAKLAGLTSMTVGGAASDPEAVIQWLDDGVAYTNGYGMTEIGSTAGMPLDIGVIRGRPAAVGIVPPTQQVRAVDADGHEVPAGTPGELWVRGPNVCLGYWNRPDETARAFAPGGWFRTGDIGVFDAAGYLTLVDRKKDMFISGGENVYPAEVEAALLAHPAVREAAVVGVADDRWGEVGCAFLIIDGEATPGALRDHCAARIAGYKVPRHFVAATAFPRTGSGKTLKHVLRAEFAAGRHQPLS